LVILGEIPSGKHTENYGKSPFSMGKSTISMAIFNSYFDITRGYLGKYFSFEIGEHHGERHAT
jgi:hypothetical protein